MINDMTTAADAARKAKAMNRNDLTPDDLQFLRLLARSLVRGNHHRLHDYIRFEFNTAFDAESYMAKREAKSNGE